MARIAMVFTGGTISMRPNAAAGGNVPVLSGADILALAPEVTQIAQIEPIDWGRVPASHLKFAQICDIARTLQAALDRTDIDGAVLVQGTDTIEETAFAFDLLLSSDKPVVVTGAMRDASAPDYDGPRNLADAVRCASDTQLRGMGVLVAMAGLVVAPDDVLKTHTSAMDTFQPRDGQPVARLIEGRVELIAARPRRRTLARIPDQPVESVHLITAVTGMDGTLVRALAPTQPRGLVIAATGAGNTSAELLNSVAQLMLKGTIVLLTTRCPRGTVAPVYAFMGGGANWQRMGVIMSALDGPKSRVALALALGIGYSSDQIAELVA